MNYESLDSLDETKERTDLAELFGTNVDHSKVGETIVELSADLKIKFFTHKAQGEG